MDIISKHISVRKKKFEELFKGFCKENFVIINHFTGCIYVSCNPTNNSANSGSKGMLKVTYNASFNNFKELYESIRITSTSNERYRPHDSKIIMSVIYQLKDDNVRCVRKLSWSDNDKILCIGKDYYYDLVYKELVKIRYAINDDKTSMKIFCKPPGSSNYMSLITSFDNQYVALSEAIEDPEPVIMQGASKTYDGYREVTDDKDIPYVLHKVAIKFHEVTAEFFRQAIAYVPDNIMRNMARVQKNQTAPIKKRRCK